MIGEENYFKLDCLVEHEGGKMKEADEICILKLTVSRAGMLSQCIY